LQLGRSCRPSTARRGQPVGVLLEERYGIAAVIWTPTAANGLGIARGALDAFAELAGTSTTMSMAPLRDRPLVQTQVAEVEAIDPEFGARLRTGRRRGSI
jgi:hypothetical protein